MIKPLFQRLVVAYNGSEASLHAVMYAVLMAKLYKCQVKVVYVVDTVTIKQLTLSKFMVKDEGDLIESNLVADGERNLSYVTKLASGKGIKVESELRKGAVWSELIKVANEYNANLILLGGKVSGNSSTPHRDVLSAHNSEVIASASCSVIVVREHYIEQLFKLA